jgi:hypothetical protein
MRILLIDLDDNGEELIIFSEHKWKTDSRRFSPL